MSSSWLLLLVVAVVLAVHVADAVMNIMIVATSVLMMIMSIILLS